MKIYPTFYEKSFKKSTFKPKIEKELRYLFFTVFFSETWNILLQNPESNSKILGALQNFGSHYKTLRAATPPSSSKTRFFGRNNKNIKVSW